MSTNFYAHWTITEGGVPYTLVLHIGKRTNGAISTYSGAVFPTLDAWKTFLRHNAGVVTVYDEYGALYDTEAFIADEMDANQDGSAQQVQWLRANGYVIEPAPFPVPEGFDAYWLDGSRLFFNGEFF